MKKQKIAFLCMMSSLFTMSCNGHEQGTLFNELMGYQVKDVSKVTYNMSVYMSFVRHVSGERISSFFDTYYVPSDFDPSIFLSSENNVDYTYRFMIPIDSTTIQNSYDQIYVYQNYAYLVSEKNDLICQSVKKINVKKLQEELARSFSKEEWEKSTSKEEKKRLIAIFLDQHSILKMTYEELVTYLGEADELEKMTYETYPTMDGGTNAYYYFSNDEENPSYFMVHFYENKPIDRYTIQ